MSVLGTESGPFQEQLVLLPTEPSPRPPVLYLEAGSLGLELIIVEIGWPAKPRDPPASDFPTEGKQSQHSPFSARTTHTVRARASFLSSREGTQVLLLDQQASSQLSHLLALSLENRSLDLTPYSAFSPEKFFRPF